MNPISLTFLAAAVVCALVGMAWGIQMSASGDHLLSPAHAHLNLLGWASLAIFGIFYQLVPAAAQGWLAKLHLALAVAGVALIVPGIAMAIRETGETLAKLGSVLTLLSMAVFLVVLLLHGRRTAT